MHKCLHQFNNSLKRTWTLHIISASLGIQTQAVMLIVSNYHYIRNDFKTPYPSIFGVTPVQFKNQLLELSKIGAFVHPKDLVSNPKFYINSKETYILITFDDGLKEQFDLAKPILENLGIGALFFVNSANFKEKEVSLVHQIHMLRSIIDPIILLNLLGNQDIFLTEEEIKKAAIHYNYDDFSAAQLKYLLNFKMSLEIQKHFIKPLFQKYFDENAVSNTLYMEVEWLKSLAKENQLGSHSHSHLPLGLLSDEEIKRELELSKTFLEEVTHSSIEAISYPYGNPEASTPNVAEIAKKAGYTLGFTMHRDFNYEVPNMLILNRFDCNDLPGGKNEKLFISCELPY